MSYVKTNWVDGENKYDLKTQSDVLIQADVKLVYKGTGGTAVSVANMQKIEDELEKIQDDATKTYYVSTAGNDSNDGSSGSPFRTLTKAAEMVRNKEIKASVTISIANGDYSNESYFNVYSIYGKGNVVIQGTGGKPILPYSPIENINITGRVILRDLEIKGNGGFGLFVSEIGAVEIDGCSFTTNCSIGAIYSEQYANILVEGNTVLSNHGKAVVASRMSTIYLKSVSGSGNTAVLTAEHGSTIIKNGSMPTGTTAETTSTGGVIR
jgi:hypothetical protein